jgi:hypothetical protein
MSLAMHAGVIERALRETAAGLSEEIRSRPFVSRAIGRLLQRRLAEHDWIKSPLLTSFLQPMGLPRLWRPSGDDIRHVVSRHREIGQRATTLDVFEDMLKRFDERSVGGVRQWFKDLGKLAGYWFDKRMQTLDFEMYVAVAMQWADLTILQRNPARKTPDFVGRAEDLIIVADAKLLLGKYWPLKIVATMLRTLEERFGLAEVGGVIVVPCRRDVEPKLLEAEVDKLTVDSLVEAVKAVATGGASFGLTQSLVIERATERDRADGQRAFAGHIPDDEGWRPFFDSLSTRAEAIRKTCEEAWDQCEAYHLGQLDPGSRLDVAFVAGEYFLLHEDLGPTQTLVREWLESEVWPAHPQRAVAMASTEMLEPVWFVNPLLQTGQSRSPAPTA